MKEYFGLFFVFVARYLILSYNGFVIINDEIILDLDCGGLKIIQSPSGYCFTTDSILLSSIVKAGASERILELGSGSGIVSFLLTVKTHAYEIIGIEIQERLYSMSLRSLDLNQLNSRIRFINADILEAGKILDVGSFDVVVTNPPYEKKAGKGIASERDICKREIHCSLKDIVYSSSKFLKFGGRFYTVIKNNRIVDLLTYMREYKIEPKRIIPVQPKSGDKIELFLVEGKRNGKSGIVFESPLVLCDETGKMLKATKDIYFGHTCKL